MANQAWHLIPVHAAYYEDHPDRQSCTAMLLHVPGDFEDDPDHRGIVILYMYMHERSTRAFPLKAPLRLHDLWRWAGLELQCLRASSWECYAFLNGDVILHGMDYAIRHGDYLRIQVEETRSRGSRNQLLPLTEDERKRKRDAQERQEHDRWPKQPVVAESLPRPSSSPMPRTDHAGYWICAAWVLMIAAGALMKMQCRKKRVTRRRTRRGVYQPTGLFGSDGTTM